MIDKTPSRAYAAKNMMPMVRIWILFVTFSLFAVAGFSQTTGRVIIPNPVLYLTGYEYSSTGGKQFIRYMYGIDNRSDFPAELFVQSPDLPPCGANTRSSRTWIDIFDQTGRRLNGFCAIYDPAKLNIWFALEPDKVPPSWIYVEFMDRKTNTKYKSNLADTTL